MSSTRRNHRSLSSLAALASSAQATSLKPPVLSSFEPSISKFLSKTVYKNSNNICSTSSCTIPSLDLKNTKTSSLSDSEECSELSLAEKACNNLARPIVLEREEVGRCPPSLLNNVSESFLYLIDARLRSSTKALLPRVLKQGGGNGKVVSEAIELIKMLLPSKNKGEECEEKEGKGPISLTTVVTSLRVVSDVNVNCEHETTNGTDVVLPLVFEAIIDLSCLGNLITVTINAPGTISGRVNSSDMLFENVEICLDCMSLLQSMMKQARSVVKKAIATASGLARSISGSSDYSSSAREPETDQVRSSSFGSSLHHSSSSFGSSLQHSCSSFSSSLHHNYSLQKDDSFPQLQHVHSNHNNDSKQSVPPLPRTMSQLSDYQANDDLIVGTPQQNEEFSENTPYHLRSLTSEELSTWAGFDSEMSMGAMYRKLDQERADASHHTQQQQYNHQSLHHQNQEYMSLMQQRVQQTMPPKKRKKTVSFQSLVHEW